MLPPADNIGNNKRDEEQDKHTEQDIYTVAGKICFINVSENKAGNDEEKEQFRQ